MARQYIENVSDMKSLNCYRIILLEANDNFSSVFFLLIFPLSVQARKGWKWKPFMSRLYGVWQVLSNIQIREMFVQSYTNVKYHSYYEC